MHKDATLIAPHRRLLVALLTAATLIGCQEGVDVAVVGIPADTVTVSVDTLNRGIARSPAKIYRYKGVGYARVLGVSPAPSYTATARRLDGCIVAVGTTDYNGEDEVKIALKAVDGCKSPAPVPTPTPTPSADLARPDMSPSDMAPSDMLVAPRDMAAPAQDMATPQPATCSPLPPLPPAIAVNRAPANCTTPTRWALDCQLHCPPVGAERIYVAYSWVLATDPLGYKMSRTHYATSTEKDVSNLSVGDVWDWNKCGGLISHTYYNVVKQPLTSDLYGVTPGAAPLCPGIKSGRLAPWESSFHFYAVQ